MKTINGDWRILFEYCMAEAGARPMAKTRGTVVKPREQLTEAERGQAQQAAAEQSARDEADRKAAALRHLASGTARKG